MSAKTLSSAQPNVTLTGLVSAYGTIGVYNINTGSGIRSETIEAAIFGPAATHFTVHNTGTITSPGTSQFDAGIALAAAGTVFNTGDIDAATDIAMFGTQGTASLQNTGALYASSGVAIFTEMAAFITNGGTIFGKESGIVLQAGGELTNAAAGRITSGEYFGVLAAGPATVTNDGTIAAASTGVTLQSGGTVKNAGLITSGGGIAITSGDAINTGTILSTGDSPGIYIGGTIAAATNATSGFISAATGIRLTTRGDVTNAGTIDATIGEGVFLTQGGTVTNSGYISAKTGFIGGGAGIAISAGGLIDNTGTIYGLSDGVFLTQGGTVADSGTIAAGDFRYAYAIYFEAGSSAASRLILSPTARLSGTIQLNGAALNLAADGKAIGTFAPATQKFLNTGAITIDSKAIWDFAGTFTTGGTITLTNDGTIKDSAAGLVTFDGPITGKGLIDLAKNPLTLNGSVASTQKIQFSGTGETLALGDPAAFDAKIEKFKLGDTIDLTSISLSAITATHFAAGVLTLHEGDIKLEFTFASPASFGGDSFKLTAAGAGTDITLVKPAALLPLTQITTLAPLATFA